LQDMSNDGPGISPSHSRVSLAMLMHNREANLLGNVHGGEIVKLADSTAGAVAQRYSGGPAVTAAMDEMAFLNPVRVGDIVHSTAQVNWAGRARWRSGSGWRPSPGTPPEGRAAEE